jgi:hypothetical protein
MNDSIEVPRVVVERARKHSARAGRPLLFVTDGGAGARNFSQSL